MIDTPIEDALDTAVLRDVAATKGLALTDDHVAAFVTLTN